MTGGTSGATANVSDYDIPTNYSSYVVVENIQGTTNLDITTFPTLDIHCVPKQYIDKSGTVYYNSTKISCCINIVYSCCNL